MILTQNFHDLVQLQVTTKLILSSIIVHCISDQMRSNN